MNLSAPSQMVFIIAVIIAIVAILGMLVVIPFVTQYAFWVLLLAFIVLTGGVLMRGA